MCWRGWGGYPKWMLVILYQSYSCLWISFMPILFRSCVLWLQFSLCVYVFSYVELHDGRTPQETNIPSRIIKVPCYIGSFVSKIECQRNYKWVILICFSGIMFFWIHLQQIRNRNYKVSKSKTISYRRVIFQFMCILFNI